MFYKKFFSISFFAICLITKTAIQKSTSDESDNFSYFVADYIAQGPNKDTNMDIIKQVFQDTTIKPSPTNSLNVIASVTFLGADLSFSQSYEDDEKKQQYFSVNPVNINQKVIDTSRATILRWLAGAKEKAHQNKVKIAESPVQAAPEPIVEPKRLTNQSEINQSPIASLVNAIPEQQISKVTPKLSQKSFSLLKALQLFGHCYLPRFFTKPNQDTFFSFSEWWGFQKIKFINLWRSPFFSWGKKNT